MDITLAQLGLSQAELTNRLVDKIIDRLWTATGSDGEVDLSEFAATLQEMVRTKIDAKVEQLTADHAGPLVERMINDLRLRPTNRWGEPDREAKEQTLTEYFVARAEAYVTELVDHNGKPKDRDSYQWSGKQTRIAYLIHEHLQHQIAVAVQAALADFNSKLAGGLAETVKLKLAETLERLKVEVKR